MTRQPAPMAALVLAGGKSSRMGRDKMRIRYHGEEELRRLLRLFRNSGIPAFVSLRPQQCRQFAGEEVPCIPDRISGIGPLAGILSAFEALPDHAWLVTAVDMPDIDEVMLSRLISRRDPAAYATIPGDEESGLLQPLFGIYEPEVYENLVQGFRRGERSLQKILKGLPVHLLPQSQLGSMENINTEEEYKAYTQKTRKGRRYLS